MIGLKIRGGNGILDVGILNICWWERKRTTLSI